MDFLISSVVFRAEQYSNLERETIVRHSGINMRIGRPVHLCKWVYVCLCAIMHMLLLLLLLLGVDIVEGRGKTEIVLNMLVFSS